MPERPTGGEEPRAPTASWCVLPWIHLYAGEQGFIRPCCMAAEQPDMINRRDDGLPHLIHAPEGLEPAWNSSFMRELRRTMLSGERPAVCRHCYRQEDLGLASYRQFSNRKFAHLIPQALAAGTPDGFAPPELLRSFDLRLGNLCNLRCRMCTPVSSRALLAEWADLQGLERDDPRLAVMRRFDWFTSASFWQSFEKYAPHIERLHFAGGEPLLIPEMFGFLERLIELGCAGGIHLSYVTNLTRLPDRIYQLWPRFKSVTLTVSLDGYRSTNSYIRYPSRWETLDRNFRRVDRDAPELNCTSLEFNTTVQAYNIFGLDELLRYTAVSFQRFSPPELSILCYPEHLSIRVLPDRLKASARERLLRFAGGFEGRWPERWQGRQLNDLKAGIKGVVEHMMGEDESHRLPEFRRHTLHMDRYRRQDLKSAVPELAGLLSENQ